MTRALARISGFWTSVGPRFLPFADATSADLPAGRLLRLSLFQISAGMALVLLNGTLNRVMIVEFGMSAALVAAMVALPVVVAPFRALIGHRSDTHRSYLGWRRVPFIWMGTLLQFGGFAIMPFALLLMSGTGEGPAWVGHLGAALAFLLVGAGVATAQTAGLALAGDLAPQEKRPRVIALLYMVLLIGTVGSGLVFGRLLEDFGPLRLVQVVQGAALATLLFNVVALWKQEARDPQRTRHDRARPGFAHSWAALANRPGARRLLVASGAGTLGFGMQDILLEPYGGQVLGLSVGATTQLTALAAIGALCAFVVAARLLERQFHQPRLAAAGALVGIVSLSAIVLSAPVESAALFRCGVGGIGFGGGLFMLATLASAMELANADDLGTALGAWGAVQATAAGLAIAAGGIVADAVASFAGALAGYTFVYHVEILLLFVTLAILGPLATHSRRKAGHESTRFGMAEFPG
jgi:BCD family chlorophyll transporter-like MFS transporter